MGTGLLPSSLESMRLGISEDDRRKTRNALKAIRKARRQGKTVNFVRRTDIPRATFEEVAKIRRQLAMLDGMWADDLETKDAVRRKLLARLKELQNSSTPGVTHAAGRGDLNDRNTVNSEAAAVAETRP